MMLRLSPTANRSLAEVPQTEFKRPTPEACWDHNAPSWCRMVASPTANTSGIPSSVMVISTLAGPVAPSESVAVSVIVCVPTERSERVKDSPVPS